MVSAPFADFSWPHARRHHRRGHRAGPDIPVLDMSQLGRLLSERITLVADAVNTVDPAA